MKEDIRDKIIVRLTSQKIEEWPDVTQTTTDLNLDHNWLTDVPDSVGDLSDLQTLSAVGNDIEYLSPNVGLLLNLRELNLIENNLQELPDSICSLTQLTKLRLLGNELTHLPENIGELVNLQHLNASENKLETVPDSFGCLQSLQFLDASLNDIFQLPESFGALSSLQNLNLSENALLYLPESFSDLPAIEILDLSHNSITSLPDDQFRSSALIKELYLDNNTLVSIPLWFCNMSQVSKISFSENKLEGDVLPSEFGPGCPLLEYLDLSGNRIDVLPSSFLSLTSLKFLDLGSVLPELERKVELLNGNALLQLPDGFGNFSNMVELRLDENPLQELPADFGTNMLSLEILDLGQDSITRLPDSFCNLHNLHTLSMPMNGLQELPENFGSLSKLISLRLDHNCLTSLPQSFAELDNLEQLDLYHNTLTDFPPCLYMMKNIKALNVEGNKFKVSEALRISRPLKYPDAKNSEAGGWRSKISSFRDVDDGEVEIIDCSSSEEDDEYEVVQGYRLAHLRRAAAKGQTAWKSHTESLNVTSTEEYTPQYRAPTQSELIDVQEDDWDAPSNNDRESEDWDSYDIENNPYGTPVVYQHPSLHPAYRLDHKFTPADIHRPSYLHLFHKQADTSVPIVEGQFDDLDI